MEMYRIIVSILLLLVSVSTFSQSPTTLFTLLDSVSTGVNFINQIKDKGVTDIFHEQNYYNGGGVAIGDINNDGLPDLFFTGNQVPDKLYMNLGSMVFKDITEDVGIVDDGNWSTGVTMVDVNNDGWLDIYVCRDMMGDLEKNRNKLYINHQGRKFEEKAKEVGLDNGSGSVQASFFDYDNDGDLDVFLANHPPNPGYFGNRDIRFDLDSTYFSRLYRNNNGIFTDVSIEAGVLSSGYLLNVITSDLNNDGLMDIYATSDFITPDYMYLNNGDGTFDNALLTSVKHTSYSAMGSDAADIDNDGLIDIISVDMAAEDNHRLKANMSGMDPEKFWDVVNAGYHYQYMFNVLQWNRGVNNENNLIYSEIGQMAGIASTDWSWAPLFADFDNDGLKDLFISNGFRLDYRNSDAVKRLTDYSVPKFKEYMKNHQQGDGNFEVWNVLDFNEVVDLYPSEKLANYIYQNKNGVEFEKKNKSWGLNQLTFSNGATYGDLDNDGDLDLVINNINDPVFIYQNNADLQGNNYLTIKLVKNGKSQSLFGSKVEIGYQLNRETKHQFFELTGSRGFLSASQPLVHFGLGDVSVIRELKVTWPNGNISKLKNIKANQSLIIDQNTGVKPKEDRTKKTFFESVTNQTGIDYVHSESNYDDYKKEILLPHKMSTIGPCMVVGDVNGDNLEDVFIGGSAGQEGTFFTQQPDGKFLKKTFPHDKILEDTGSLLFDADQDGDLDLYVVSGSNEFKASYGYIDRLYLNDGAGNFERSFTSLPQYGISGSVVKSFDYNNDGLDDLFVGGRQVPGQYPSPADSYILENRGLNQENVPVFIDVTDKVAPFLKKIGMVTDVVCADIDSDGSTDLLIVGEWMHPFILLNQGGQFKIITSGTGLEDKVGWWFSAKSADFDNDGDLDFVLGNLGLNYKYKASMTEPFEVYYDDFDQNGSGDIVLSYYNFGEKYPLRGRSCSSNQVISLKDKFPDYTSFSMANLEMVYGVQGLSSALHYQATEFGSLYVENLGNGRFKTRRLVKEAQISAVQDMIIKDFNEDGNADILLAGGLYDAEVETARNDAGVGLLLIGNGKGEFEPMAPMESGIFMYSNVKGLDVLNWKGQELIISISNNDRLAAYVVNTK